MRVEVLLAGTQVPAAPEPLPVHDLVEVDLWDQLPADLPALLALLPQADLYLQDEHRLPNLGKGVTIEKAQLILESTYFYRSEKT